MTEIVIEPNLVDTAPIPYLLLVVKDDQIVDQIASLVSDSCSIVRFRNVEDAEEWLTYNPTIDLMITDTDSGQTLASLARVSSTYQSVPILIACRFAKPNLLDNALTVGVTDILTIGKDDYALQSKIRYYLELNTRIISTAEKKPSPAIRQFELPWWKRAIDITASFSILLALSPLLLLVAALIKLDSKGPILYKSKRAGTNFHVFSMFKFRTMSSRADQQLRELASQNIYTKPQEISSVEDAIDSRTAFVCDSCRQRGVTCQQPLYDQDQLICEKLFLRENEEAAKFMKFRNDPRITRLGSILRNSSIDELPQLLNILIGDMSLVGNRPLPLYEAEKLTSDEFAQRFAGPAGLTGLWQITKRAKGQGPMSDWERTQPDIMYSRTFSFQTDMHILWRTIFSLWQKENV